MLSPKKTSLGILLLILLIGTGVFIVKENPLLSLLRSSSVESPCTRTWYKENATKYGELLEARDQAETLLGEIEQSLEEKNDELQKKNTEKARIRTGISQAILAFQNTFSSPGTALPNYTTACSSLTAFNRATCDALKAIEMKKSTFKKLTNETAKLTRAIKKASEEKSKTQKTLALGETLIEEYEICGESLKSLTLVTPNGGEIFGGFIDIQWKGGMSDESIAGILLELQKTNGDFVGIIAKNQLPDSHYLWNTKTVCASVGTGNTCSMPREVPSGSYVIVVSYTVENNTKISDASDAPIRINGDGEDTGALSSLDVIMPAEVTAGEAFDVTIRALKNDRTIFAGYVGTVRIDSLYGSSEDVASFKKYTFSASDKGSHYFTKSITLKKSGKYMLRFSDESTGKEIKVEITAKSSGGTTTGALDTFSIDASSSVSINQPFTLTTKALKSDGSTFTGYRGTISFVVIPSTSEHADSFDLNIPWTYTYLATDNGTHTFSQAITFKSAGEYTLSVYDQVTNINQSVTIVAR